MAALEKSPRREMVFGASAESWAKIDRLMEQQGHQAYALTIARGFALVQWVLDEQAAGRFVGSYDQDADDFTLLEERPELLGPRPRLQAVPDLAPPVAPAPKPAPEPAPDLKPEPIKEPDPAPAPVEAIAPEPVATPDPEPAPVATAPAPIAPNDNPKLKARERVPVPPKPKPFKQPQRRKNLNLSAYRSDDETSPVKSLQFEIMAAKGRNRPPPIEHGNKPLPAELNQSYAKDLRIGMAMPEATHFRIVSDLVVLFGFFPKKGWCYYDMDAVKWFAHREAGQGLVSLYSIDIAMDYLQRNSAPAPVEEPDDPLVF